MWSVTFEVKLTTGPIDDVRVSSGTGSLPEVPVVIPILEMFTVLPGAPAHTVVQVFPLREPGQLMGLQAAEAT